MDSESSANKKREFEDFGACTKDMDPSETPKGVSNEKLETDDFYAEPGPSTSRDTSAVPGTSYSNIEERASSAEVLVFITIKHFIVKNFFSHNN